LPTSASDTTTTSTTLELADGKGAVSPINARGIDQFQNPFGKGFSDWAKISNAVKAEVQPATFQGFKGDKNTGLFSAMSSEVTNWFAKTASQFKSPSAGTTASANALGTPAPATPCAKELTLHDGHFARSTSINSNPTLVHSSAMSFARLLRGQVDLKLDAIPEAGPLPLAALFGSKIRLSSCHYNGDVLFMSCDNIDNNNRPVFMRNAKCFKAGNSVNGLQTQWAVECVEGSDNEVRIKAESTNHAGGTNYLYATDKLDRKKRRSLMVWQGGATSTLDEILAKSRFEVEIVSEIDNNNLHLRLRSSYYKSDSFGHEYVFATSHEMESTRAVKLCSKFDYSIDRNDSQDENATLLSKATMACNLIQRGNIRAFTNPLGSLVVGYLPEDMSVNEVQTGIAIAMNITDSLPSNTQSADSPFAKVVKSVVLNQFTFTANAKSLPNIGLSSSSHSLQLGDRNTCSSAQYARDGEDVFLFGHCQLHELHYLKLPNVCVPDATVLCVALFDDGYSTGKQGTMPLMINTNGTFTNLASNEHHHLQSGRVYLNGITFKKLLFGVPTAQNTPKMPTTVKVPMFTAPVTNSFSPVTPAKEITLGNSVRLLNCTAVNNMNTWFGTTITPALAKTHRSVGNGCSLSGLVYKRDTTSDTPNQPLQIGLAQGRQLGFAGGFGAAGTRHDALIDVGVWNSGDLIGTLPPDSRPKDKCYFMVLACAAPKWPTS